MTDRRQSKYERLMKAVRAASSQTDDYQQMIDEWVVTGYRHDESCGGVCTCGKTGLAHIFTIWNRVTREELSQIGSECIQHFDDERMDVEARLLRLRFANEQRGRQREREKQERLQMQAEERAERERLEREEWERARPEREEAARRAAERAREEAAAERERLQREAERTQRIAQEARAAEGRRVLQAGKHAGRTFQWVVENTHGYIEFVEANGHKPELKALVRYARGGR